MGWTDADGETVLDTSHLIFVREGLCVDVQSKLTVSI
jgi:hypothetical protein